MKFITGDKINYHPIYNEDITDQLINNKWEYKINNDLFFLILEDNKNYVIDFPALNTKIKSIRI